jgi:hypothetical protein
MKTTRLSLLILFSALFLISACKKDDNDDNTNPTGNLQMKFSWYSSKGDVKGDTNTCDLIDIKGTLLEIAVSKDAIVDGQPDNLNWTTIYTTSSSMYFTERQCPVVSLPAGNYKSIKIVQKNAINWKCIFNTDTLEFEDLNNSSLPADTTIPANYFYSDGLHELDASGNFFMHQSEEKLGGFEILDGQTTNLSWRMNIIHLDWIDTNTNGIWDTGIDGLDNWQLPPGVTTMFDFIVTY